jgi:hypothetical protein
MPETVSRLVVHSFRENQFCFGCSKPMVGVDTSFNHLSKVLKTLSGLNFSVSPKRRRSCGVFGMPPNPSLNTDVPRAGAAPAAAGRRLAQFR